MRQSNKLELKTRQKIALTKKIIVVAGVSAITGLAVSFYFFFNVADVKEAKGAQISNTQAGSFEEGLSSWTASGYGTWDITSLAGEFRGGNSAAQLTTFGAKEGVLANEKYTVTVPQSGTNYITVIVYSKASHCKNQVAVGLINQADGEVIRSQGLVADSAWTVVQATFPVKNGGNYYPVLFARRGNEGPMTHINFDDLVVYCSQLPYADFHAPEKPTGSTDLVGIAGAKVPLSWMEGKDAGAGLAGTLILRADKITSICPVIKPQTNYTSGLAYNKEWKVVYSGNISNMLVDNVDTSAAYTYLIYNRDLAFNYSAPLQLHAKPQSKNTERPLVNTPGDTIVLAANNADVTVQLADGKLSKTWVAAVNEISKTEENLVFKAWYSHLDDKIYTSLNKNSGNRKFAALIDINGKILERKEIPLNFNETRIIFDMTGLSNGIYTIILEGGEKTRALKVVKN